MDNDQKDNRNFFRVKSSLWGQWDYDKSLSLYAKLTNEFKAYTYFAGTSSSVPDKTAKKKGYHFDINEVVFDNLYVDVYNFLDLPVNLRIGRQDLNNYGESFLFGDGTPGDGSRTYYFNAAKATWNINNNNALDVIYIDDPRDEEFLPIINRTKLVNASNPTQDKVPQQLNTTDEQAYVLYLKNKSIKDLAPEFYYVFKKEAQEGGVGLQSKETKLNTLGSFIKYNFSPWAIRTQFAYQFGKYGENDRVGIGGYGFLDREFKNLAWSPLANIGYIYLSGDDRNTNKNEAWDPLFSRYPWISELYNLSMAAETSITGYWTNLQAIRSSLILKPTGKAKVSIWYNFLMADKDVAPSALFSGTGKNRGHLCQARIDYAFNKNISTYFLAEYLVPGNFYKDRDEALFLRTEFHLKF
jgi:hypothetical protein